MSIVIGIISYFPDKQPDRDLRINRFNSLLKKINQIWSNIPILVVAQNWGDYNSPKNLEVHRFDKLGILGARKMLRKIFLDSHYKDMITLDDDAIISGDSGEEYLNQVRKHPDGMGVFCWEHSQLNMLYISKFIYSKVDLPDVDPEKDQGFEDVIFTAQCKKMFPDKVFTFTNTGLSESSFRYTGDDRVPSTWAGNTHDWKKLRENTKKLKEDIERGVPKKTPTRQVSGVDLVVTYVDLADPEWQKLYNKYSPQEFSEEVNGKQRFRGNPFFKYWFRGVENNTPWVDNIFLVVQSMSQVPTWLNTQNVKVVLHEDFIPKEYLPTFNSQTIEMFIHRIPELSERFLYANDDVYFTGPLTQKNFFVGNKTKGRFKQSNIGDPSHIPLWKNAILNSHKLVNEGEQKNFKTIGKYLTPLHGTRPYIKSVLFEFFEANRESILSSISQFREEKNVNMYVYDFYMKSKGLIVDIDFGFVHYSSKTPLGFIRNCLVNPQLNHMLCLNDTSEDEDEQRDKEIIKAFENRFPFKCKFEK